MFGVRKNRRAKKLLASMSEQEKIEVRAMVVFHLSLAAQVHMMTTSEASATRHADVFEAIGERQGVSVGRLVSDGRAAAYQAKIVVGPLSEFLVDFAHQDSVRDKFAVVEGKPVSVSRQMLSRYRESRIT